MRAAGVHTKLQLQVPNESQEVTAGHSTVMASRQSSSLDDQSSASLPRQPAEPHEGQNNVSPHTDISWYNFSHQSNEQYAQGNHYQESHSAEGSGSDSYVENGEDNSDGENSIEGNTAAHRQSTEAASDVQPLTMDNRVQSTASGHAGITQSWRAERDRESRDPAFRQRNAKMDDPEDPTFAKDAHAVYHWLSPEWHGCGAERHAELLHQHVQDVSTSRSECARLNGTYSDLLFPYQSTNVGLSVPGFPTRTQSTRSSFAAPHHMRMSFEGTDDDSVKPPSVCLHLEDQDDIPGAGPYTTFGVDSMIMIGKGFGMFTTGLRLCFSYNSMRNIQDTLHLPFNIRTFVNDETLSALNSQSRRADDRTHPDENQQNGQTPRRGRVKTSFFLRDLVHIYIGQCDAFAHQPIYIFFPRISMDDHKSNRMTLAHFERFYDHILWPACKKALLPQPYGELPTSQAVAESAAKAHAKEQGIRDGPRKKYLHYYFAAETLSTVWDEMQRAIDSDPTLWVFKDMFVCLDVKNYKLENEATHLFKAMDLFDQKLEANFNESLIPITAIDIAKAAVPYAQTLEQDSYYKEQFYYLWKDCCVQRFYDTLVLESFNGNKGSASFYNVGHLRDAKCLGVEPPHRSDAWKSGIRYVQLYTSVKKILEASTIWPFTGERLLQLAVDDNAYAAAMRAAKKQDYGTRDGIKRNWASCKERLFEELETEAKSSKGVRLEVRLLRQGVSWNSNKGMWWGLKKRAFNSWLKEQRPGSDSTAILESVYTVRAETYTKFLRGNFQKYTSLFEICAITGSSRRSLDRSVFMHVVLLAMQSFLNSNLDRKSVLAKAEEVTHGVTYHGLGFNASLKTYGYCWWTNIVDWDQLCFRDNVRDSLLGHIERQLLPWYAETPDLLRERELSNTTQRLYLRKAVGNPTLQQKLFQVVAHELFRRYRLDVWHALQKMGGLVPERKADAFNDNVRFCKAGMESSVAEPKVFFTRKPKMADPRLVFDMLWTNRTAWSSKGKTTQFKRDVLSGLEYRQQLQAWTTELSKYMPTTVFESFLYHEFFRYHTVIPYPNSDSGSIIKNVGDEGGRKLFYTLPETTAGEFRFAKQGEQGEVVQEYPVCLRMSANEKMELLDIVGEEDKTCVRKWL